jgi:hypothetical protein
MPKQYEVKKGETLGDIARKLRLHSWKYLYQLNRDVILLYCCHCCLQRLYCSLLLKIMPGLTITIAARVIRQGLNYLENRIASKTFA